MRKKANWKTDAIGYGGRTRTQTVLPVCAGGRRLNVLRDTYHAKFAGREVTLELYVDHGNC
ncbi:hypothetical protein ACLB1N_05400 [Escherichia coli]